MLGAIRKGRWSYEDCTYVPFFREDLLRGADVGCQMSVRGDGDMGNNGTCFSSVKEHACSG